MNDKLRRNQIEISLPFDHLGLEVGDVENAMGRYEKGTPAPFPELISKAIDEVGPCIEIRGGYRLCREIFLLNNHSTLLMENVAFSIGRIIGQQIAKADSIVVFACTIGSKISEFSKNLMEKGDVIKAYVVDTIGSVAVEKAMDKIQEKIAAAEMQQGRKITNRFSPGYCNWDVAEQQQLFSLLSDRFCGISLSESALMQPLKSVSGIIGAGEKVRYLDYPCKICKMQKCFRRKFH